MTLDYKTQVAESIKKSNKILITFKKDYEIDTLASALALSSILKKEHKQVDVICDNFILSEKINFLPFIDEIKKQEESLNKFIISLDVSKTGKIDEFSYDIVDDKLNIYIVPKKGNIRKEDISFSSSGFKYDLIITLNTTENEQLGNIYDHNTDFFYNTPIINIDHVSGNEHYGQINIVDINSCSTAEIIYDLFAPSNMFFDEDISTLLLAGIIDKSKSFQTFRISPKTLKIVGQLIANGARREEIVQNLYRTKTVSTLKAWGKILENLKTDSDLKLVWAVLNYDDVQKFKVTDEIIFEVVNDLITTAKEAKIIVIIYEYEISKFRSIIIGDKNIKAKDLVSEFDPKLENNTAIIETEGIPISEVEKRIISEIQSKIKQIPDKNIE